MSKVEIRGDKDDCFVIRDGVKIARRGHPGTADAGRWVSLDPHWEVIDDGDEMDTPAPRGVASIKRRIWEMRPTANSVIKPAFGVPSLETATRIDISDQTNRARAAQFRMEARMRELERQFEDKASELRAAFVAEVAEIVGNE